MDRSGAIAKAVLDEFDKFGCVNTVIICGRLNQQTSYRFRIAEVEDFLISDGFVKRSQFVWQPRENIPKRKVEVK